MTYKTVIIKIGKGGKKKYVMEIIKSINVPNNKSC